MFAPLRGTAGLAVLGALAMIAGAAGCAPKVTRQDFDSEVARLREEMQAGDRQLGTRIDSTAQLAADHQRRLDALEKELQAFRSEYHVSIETLKGMLKFDVPVHFDFDRAELREGDQAVLGRFAEVVRGYYPGALITVEGFTDPAGTAAYNRRLGLRRAQAVREYLTTTGGLPSDRIKTVSYGEDPERQVVPGAKGPGPRGLENRRVALVVDYAGTSGPEVALP